MAWASFTGLAKRLDAALIDNANEQRALNYAKSKRLLTDNDIDSFNEAADQRKPQRTQTNIIEALRKKDGHRMWRLQRDYRWMQKQMKKMGLNPEDARWLL